MTNATDRRLRRYLLDEFGAQFRDRSAELHAAFGADSPLRPGGPARIEKYVLHHTAGSARGSYDQVWDLHVRRMGWSTAGETPEGAPSRDIGAT